MNVDPVATALFIAGTLVTAYLTLLVALRLVAPLRRVGARFGGAFAAPFSSTLGDLGRDARFDRLEDEIRRDLGERDEWGDEARADIVAAAEAAQRINIINQKLRTTVRQCLATHWAVASGSGALHMSDAARHPLSRQLRQRVIDLSDLLSHKIATYPLVLESPDLIRLQLGLRWIPTTCATCPYWSTSVAEAPRVCPTAKAMATERGSSHGVADAEIVDDCDDGGRR